jgi:hypothetical protein
MDFSLKVARLGFVLAILMTASVSMADKAIAGQGERRPIRATVGCVEYRNWQENLVKTNPNLAHYHWNPIYVNVQGVRLVGPPPPPKQLLTSRPKKQPSGGKPSKNHVKNQQTAYIFRPNKERPSIYKKPTRIAPQRSTHTAIAYKHTAPQHRTGTSLAYTHVAPQLSSRDVQGQLSSRDAQGRLTSRDAQGRLISRDATGRLIPNDVPVTATDMELRRKALMAKIDPARYQALVAQQKKLEMAEKYVAGTLSHKDCHGVLTHQEVEGQLVARAGTASLAEPAKVYGAYTRGESGITRRQTKTSVDAQLRNY